MNQNERRHFLQMVGAGAAMAGTLHSNIAKALTIQARRRSGTITDVEHIVVLTQENRPFDHHFGTLRGVRGFSDPRAVNIHLPLQGGGSAQVPVFLQPAGAGNTAAGYGVPAGDVGGPVDGVAVIPPFRINPASVASGLTSLGLTYLPGTDHGWTGTHLAWNQGQYDNWAVQKGPMAMSYMTRDDLPYHYALADAFTVGDAYHCSIMGPTNPNRCYLWSGCIGNLDGLGSGGTDGLGAGPITYNGLSVNNAYLSWRTFPEVLQAAGVRWKIYQDLAGATFSPDFGDGTGNGFAGNYTDNAVLYFNQYANAPAGTPLFDYGCTGTRISDITPPAGSPSQAWRDWAQHLFDQFRSDVNNGTLPQVSWIVAPAGYTEHSDFPINYGAWYLSQIFDILVSNPDVFSKTVFLVNYDEADGSFDHVVPATPAQSPAFGASTVSIENEIVNDVASSPVGPIGLGTRVPFLAISPWSKGGYVNSQVFDHTSIIQFIEKRFGVLETNISPWRRAVAGDLTSVFNFASPNDDLVRLPRTDGYLPSAYELAGNGVNTFYPSLNTVLLGAPAQEKGVRPARALPYEMHVHQSVDKAAGTVTLAFFNTGAATVVYQVRSANAADPVRSYTVEPGKQLAGVWTIAGTYDLSVYGPNGFARQFKGGVATGSAALDVKVRYEREGWGGIALNIANRAGANATVSVLNAYSGNRFVRLLPGGAAHEAWTLQDFPLHDYYGWYDLAITVEEDPTLTLRLAGHVETGKDSYSDPALGGLVTLKA